MLIVQIFILFFQIFLLKKIQLIEKYFPEFVFFFFKLTEVDREVLIE